VAPEPEAVYLAMSGYLGLSQAFFQFNNDFLKKLLFYTLRLPGIYILITLGIMFDFILHLPFLTICSVENLFRRRTH